MGKPLIDLVGHQFGSLTVLRLGEKRRLSNGAWWLCRCVCGNEKSISASDLKSKRVNSCGCQHKERISKASKTHGMTGTRTYRIWQNMKNRCKNHADYFGRGIVVCDRWMFFENFLSDMGVCPDKHSIDRVDVNGNYEPSNCRWVDHLQQMNNTRRNVFIEFDGKRLTISQWARKLSLKPNTIKSRMRYGWDLANVLNPKLAKHSAAHELDLSEGAELLDADGNTMSAEQVTEFVNTLP